MTPSARRRAIVLAPAVLLACLIGTVPAAAQQVRVWLTTSDQGVTLEEQRSIAFAGRSSPAEAIVVIDERERYQTIEGFGASFTDSAAYLLNQVARPAERDAAMRRLFTREEDGIGVSFVRNPMAASDLARFHYSYADSPSSAELPGFSIAHDHADIIPLVLQAGQLNPELTIMASPWSPPGWMKSSGSMTGGALLPARYPAFAAYLVKYLQAYAAAGIRVHYISLQNEPLYVPPDYPGMFMDAATQAALLRDHVLPALASSGLPTRVLVYDHNWDRADYPETVLQTLGASTLAPTGRVAGVAWHGYGGTPGAMTTVRNRFPAASHHVTEASGGTWVADQVRADFQTIVQSMRNWARSFVKWSLALDQNRGPHAGGCDSCTPLVTVDTRNGTVSYPVDFFTLGHFSKFVLPGAVRVYSSNGDGIVSVAFVNPDGSRALVAFNDTSERRSFQVRWGTRVFTTALPALSGATFVWSGAQNGEAAVSARDRIHASSFHETSGLQTETSTDTPGGFNIGYAEEGDFALYREVDFGRRVTAVDVRVASAGSGGTLEFRVDAPDGPVIATAALPVTGGWQDWTTVTAPVARVSGRRDLYLVLRGQGQIGNVNWFRFR